MRGPTAEQASHEVVSQLLEFHRRGSQARLVAPVPVHGHERRRTDRRCRVHRRPHARHIGWAFCRETLDSPHVLVSAPDFKMKKGSRPRRAGTREPAGEIFSLDEHARRLQLKLGPKGPALDDLLSLIPEAPFDDKVLREAVLRYATAVIVGDNRYAAVTSLLKRELPRIGAERSARLCRQRRMRQSAARSSRLRTSSRVTSSFRDLRAQEKPSRAAAVVELLRRGRRVGVASTFAQSNQSATRGGHQASQAAHVAFRGARNAAKTSSAAISR